jgi:hypothetical protein
MSNPIPLVPGCKIRYLSLGGPGVWHDVVAVDPLDLRTADGSPLDISLVGLQWSYDHRALEVLQPEEVAAHPLSRLLNQPPCALCDDTGWASPGTLSRVPCMCAAGREQADKLRRSKPEAPTRTLTVTWAPQIFRLLQAIGSEEHSANTPELVAAMGDMTTNAVFSLLTVCLQHGLVTREAGAWSLTDAGRDLAEKGASA